MSTLYNPLVPEDRTFFGVLDLALANVETGDDPITFEEALSGPNGSEGQEAIDLELRHMFDKGVWRIVKKATIPRNRRLIDTKWVFKTKHVGGRQARVNGQGVYQIPGTDFKESFSPVVHEVTIQGMSIVLLIGKLSAMLADVETASLYGELEEEIYMKAPKGSVLMYDECLLLLEAKYGLVEASRQWRKKLVFALKKFGFKVSEVDPCLMLRQCELEFVLC